MSSDDDGPGPHPHAPESKSVETHLELCMEAPFYTWGRSHGYPPGYDHITIASGRRWIGCYGTASPLLRHAKAHWPAEQEDVKDVVIAYKIAAHRRVHRQGPPRRQSRDDGPLSKAASTPVGRTSSTSSRPETARDCPRRDPAAAGPSWPTSAACAAEVLQLKITQRSREFLRPQELTVLERRGCRNAAEAEDSLAKAELYSRSRRRRSREV